MKAIVWKWAKLETNGEGVNFAWEERSNLPIFAVKRLTLKLRWVGLFAEQKRFAAKGLPTIILVFASLSVKSCLVHIYSEICHAQQ